MQSGAAKSNVPPRPVVPPMPGKAAPTQSAAPQARATFSRPSGTTAPSRPNIPTPGTSLNKLTKRIGGRNSFKQLLLSTLAFFALFTILATSKFINDHSHYKAAETEAFQTELAVSARNVAQTLDREIAWMDTALSLKGSPQQVINFVARGPRVAGTALIDTAGTVIASTPGAGAPLSAVDRRNFPNGGVKVTSLISDTGNVTPVVIRKTGDAYLVVALAPYTLIGNTVGERSLIEAGGRVIDGKPDVARQGVMGYYKLSPARLSDLTKGAHSEKVVTHTRGKDSIWLGAAKIPNSYLTVVESLPRGVSPGLKQNIILFGLLFIGTAWLIWAIMSQLLKQLDAVRKQQDEDEVSRRRYQAAIDGSRGGVWEIDLLRNKAYLSPSLAKLFGMPERETHITLPQFLGLFTAADRDKLYHTIRRCHVTGEFDMDLGVAHLPVFIAVNGKPSMHNTNQAKMVTGMALDVTEARGSKMRLQSAEARLHDALSSMNDSFVIWDQMDRLVLWNAKFEDFFGFVSGNLQQGMEHSLIEYHSNKAVDEIFRLEDGKGSEILLKDGRWVRYLETYTKDGGRVSIGTDVTGIRTREQQLQVNQDALERTISVLKKSQVRIVELAENYEQEKIRAEEANQSKSEFLANMSHELRTPLNAINGFSDIMKKELFGPLGDPRYKEYVNDILFSGQHLLSLINDILDMSKIEAGKMTLNVEAMQLNEMIEQVLRIVRGRAEENRLKLVYNKVDTQEIEADPRAVKQILLNLATNAIKFTPEGGVVRIAVEPKQAGLIVRVSDTGIGISQEDIARLAQPFEQIDSQHSRQHEGTGLGLALSKSLVELHGGNFSIENTVGQGTTVIFTLPSRPPAQKAIADDNEVGNEISRLAQDIADVLNEGSVNQAIPADQSVPTYRPTEFDPHGGQIAPHAAAPNPQAPPQVQAAPPPYVPQDNSSAA
ncbi:PAS domain-containing sensor histidine kinase [Litorimonas sp. RW-G-Af-16]|uniref:PAS domain-containing sensor histidine kinase n=1 Tax=Litorimonas sp. RW-G-Af-16 TaxID=3241168 RepID=UPI003AAED2BA